MRTARRAAGSEPLRPGCALYWGALPGACWMDVAVYAGFVMLGMGVWLKTNIASLSRLLCSASHSTKYFPHLASSPSTFLREASNIYQSCAVLPGYSAQSKHHCTAVSALQRVSFDKVLSTFGQFAQYLLVRISSLTSTMPFNRVFSLKQASLPRRLSSTARRIRQSTCRIWPVRPALSRGRLQTYASPAP